jgi:cholera toxin transcriptional activator
VKRYRFGVFEVDGSTGELWRKGMRVRIHAQPFQVLMLLLEKPGEMLTREEIAHALWPNDTFVDYEQGVNSAVNRLRDALGDKASNPRFVETLARRGYRFIAPVDTPEPVDHAPETPVANEGIFDRILAAQDDLPGGSHSTARFLFVGLQVMYVSFYVGALANLTEIYELMSRFDFATQLFWLMAATAAVLIPMRAFLISATLFRAPGFQKKFLSLWWSLLAADLLWAFAPFLLLNHINAGLALACTTLLLYAPFAQRSLMLMLGRDLRTSL